MSFPHPLVQVFYTMFDDRRSRRLFAHFSGPSEDLVKHENDED